ncbi:MAG: hypothetical protein WBM72_13640 [Actinomycetota bacterium]
MNRWHWAALAVMVVGLAVAFLVGSYSSGACDTASDCGPGLYLRIMSVMLTLLVAFVLFVIGATTDKGTRRERT